MQIRFGFHWVIANSIIPKPFEVVGGWYIARVTLTEKLTFWYDSVWKININEYTPLLIFENYS